MDSLIDNILQGDDSFKQKQRASDPHLKVKQEQSGPFEISKPSPNSSPDDKLDKIIQNAAGSGEGSPPDE